jgi:general secretion pathway protein K
VLVIVLIVTTLLVSLSSEFIVVAQTNLGYLKKLDNRLKATMLAKSGIELSEYILKADKKGISGESLTGKMTDKNIDSYNDIWAINFPPVPLDEGEIKLEIIDENSKINLSVLANEFVDKTPYYAIAQRFFLNMGLPMDLADIIVDWVDIDDSRFPFGAESSDYYQSQVPPYSAKNNAMDSIDELLMLKDFTPEIYYGMGGGNSGIEENLVDNNRGDVNLDFSKIADMTGEKESVIKDQYSPEEKGVSIGKEKNRALQDYFRVYGNREDYLNELNKININTAPFRVLAALTDNMTDDIVTQIITNRTAQPYKSVNEVKDLIQDETVLKNILTVKSHIFKIIATATTESATVKITAYYNRDSHKVLYWSEE